MYSGRIRAFVPDEKIMCHAEERREIMRNYYGKDQNEINKHKNDPESQPIGNLIIAAILIEMLSNKKEADLIMIAILIYLIIK